MHGRYWDPTQAKPIPVPSISGLLKNFMFSCLWDHKFTIYICVCVCGCAPPPSPAYVQGANWVLKATWVLELCLKSGKDKHLSLVINKVRFKTTKTYKKSTLALREGETQKTINFILRFNKHSLLHRYH